MNRLLEALNAAAETPRAMHGNRLHICTYHTLCRVIKTVVDDHEPAYTGCEEIADWCEKQPELTVSKKDGIWRIEMREEGESDL